MPRKRIVRNRPFALLLALALLLGGCQLSQEPLPGVLQNEADSGAQIALQEINTLKIAYSKEDSLIPYQAQSMMNLNVLPLIYDPLIKLDQEYVPHNIIAKEVVTTAESCIVTVRDDIVFSDGTPLTAQDVLYSARQAVASSIYGGAFWRVEEVELTEEGAVAFILSDPDPLFENLLTFPIVCEQNPELGSGRYIRSGETLSINPRWYGENNGAIKTIQLINQLDKDTLIYSLKLGTINYMYSDLSGNEATALGISTQTVPMNNLIYLGVNATRSGLSRAQMRHLLSLAIDRKGLAEEVYASRAQPAYTPFQPNDASVKELGLVQEQDYQAAAALLEELGYHADRKDSEGYYVSGQGRLRFRLLVNSDNSSRMQLAQELQKSFAELGIELSIDARGFEQYQAALGEWDFDLFLGEVKLYNNHDLTALLSSEEKLGYGVVDDDELLALYEAYRMGTVPLEDFIAAFNAEPVFIPLMYRSGVVSFSREIYYNTSATEQDIFYQIEAWQ